MKSDTQLKSDVTSELAWEPSINATGIGVMVKDGHCLAATRMPSSLPSMKKAWIFRMSRAMK